MSIRVKEVTTAKERKCFVQLPFLLYKNNPYWVPPLTADEMDIIDPASNPYHEFCESKFWIAIKNGQCAGRIGAIINHWYNTKAGEQLARFTRFESIEDKEVSAALLMTAEEWATEKKMKGIMGPLGFSNLDMQGLLIEGFDFLPSVASTYHHPYYQQLIESAGYEKVTDWVEFRLTVGRNAIDKANRGAQLIQKRYGLKTIHFHSSRELSKYTGIMFDILHDSFSDLPFVAPFNEELKRYYTRKYIKLLNPEFVKIVTLQDEPVGFIVGMPSLSAAMQKAHGRMFPFGFYHLLKARKGKDTMDQLLTGVKKQFQSTGAGVVLMAELQNEMLKKGMTYIETTGIFESNQSAIGNWKNYEHIQHKRRRCYKKEF